VLTLGGGNVHGSGYRRATKAKRQERGAGFILRAMGLGDKRAT